MVYEPMKIRPSSWFDYAELAIQYLCRGCPNAGGTCGNALAIRDDVPGSVRKVDGRIRCAVRPPDPEPEPDEEEAPEVDPRQMRLFGEGA